MKFFSTSQIQQLDQFTIAHEPITSLDLMERAADALFEAYTEMFAFSRPVLIFAGPGNNGGDALALARKLKKLKLDVKLILMHQGKCSSDCESNKNRLLEIYPEIFEEQTNTFVPPIIENNALIIDGLFGSGLKRPLEGIFADAVAWMNNSGNEILSIDIPSGLHGDNNTNLTLPIVKAQHTFSLHLPKLAFLLADSAQFVGEWQILNIGLHPQAIASTESIYHFQLRNDMQAMLKTRPKFSHKGTYGHLLILAGCKDMAGAAVLSAKAALRSGAGLVTVHSASANRSIVQTALPEAIFQSDASDDFISELPNIEHYNALAIGPGIGQQADTVKLLKQLLALMNNAIVLDADALNIISRNKELLALIPENSILTPHPKEFERLFGTCHSAYERMTLAQQKAKDHKIIIVLKGAHTLIALPNGQLIFNSTGNNGMATAGTGDVLTGIIGSLLAQGYTSAHAAQIGVYLHGLAADLALNTQSKESLIAGDIIEHLGKAFKAIN